jgi:hypothetical protein
MKYCLGNSIVFHSLYMPKTKQYIIIVIIIIIIIIINIDSINIGEGGCICIDHVFQCQTCQEICKNQILASLFLSVCIEQPGSYGEDFS